MNSRKDGKRRSFQQLNLLLSVGMVFPVSIVIGYGIGYMLDKWLGILPPATVEPVVAALERIIDRERGGYSFDVSIKATLIKGEKRAH